MISVIKPDFAKSSKLCKTSGFEPRDKNCLGMILLHLVPFPPASKIAEIRGGGDIFLKLSSKKAHLNPCTFLSLSFS